MVKVQDYVAMSNTMQPDTAHGHSGIFPLDCSMNISKGSTVILRGDGDVRVPCFKGH
jgi:hypothetical protein